MAARCPICGAGLSRIVAGCARCPLSGGCRMMGCRSCGYETVAPRSAVIDFLKHLFRRRLTHGGAP
jgi:hypothetical protein